MRRPLIIAAAGLCALAAGGCERAPLTPADGATVALVATDYRLHPQRVGVAAGRITFRIRNDGRVPHNLQIRKSADDVRARVSTLLPGESGSVTVRLAPGRYEMLSTVTRDEQLGERGTVLVR